MGGGERRPPAQAVWFAAATVQRWQITGTSSGGVVCGGHASAVPPGGRGLVRLDLVARTLGGVVSLVPAQAVALRLVDVTPVVFDWPALRL